MSDRGLTRFVSQTFWSDRMDRIRAGRLGAGLTTGRDCPVFGCAERPRMMLCLPSFEPTVLPSIRSMRPIVHSSSRSNAWETDQGCNRHGAFTLGAVRDSPHSSATLRLAGRRVCPGARKHLPIRQVPPAGGGAIATDGRPSLRSLCGKKPAEAARLSVAGTAPRVEGTWHQDPDRPLCQAYFARLFRNRALPQKRTK